MSECIACKSNYTPESPCPRCGTDNEPWEQWQRNHRGLSGWIGFMSPALHLPVLLTASVLPMGAVGLRCLWLTKRVAWFWSVPLLLFLTFVCILIMVTVYADRNRLREQESLNRVRRGPARFLDAQFRVGAVPITVFVAILAWTVVILSRPVSPAGEQNHFERILSTIESDGLFSAATSEAVIDVLTLGGPLSIATIGYVSLLPALVYSTSLGLALHYAHQMNQEVPLPIFLSPVRLVKLVQSEAEQEFSSLGPGLVWEGVERTKDGGVKLTARYRQDRKIVEDLAGKKSDLPMHTKYEVVADPWGRIRSISPKSELMA